MKQYGVACLVAVALLCLSCSGEDRAGEQPLRIGWYRWLGWYPAAIVERNDKLRGGEANVELVLYDNYTELLVDVASGKLDGCFTGLYEVLRSGISDLKVTLVTDYSSGAEGLVVVPEIKNPTDLKGKRIGIQGGASGSEFVITTLLRRHGLTPSDLRLVDLEPEYVLDEMPLNVDGGYTWDPYLALAQDKGYRVLFSTADVPGMVVDVVVFRGDACRQRGGDVTAFHAAWFEALDFWDEYPEEAARIVADRVGGEVAVGKPVGCTMLDLGANRAAFLPGDSFASLYYTGARQIEFFMELGGVSVRPDLGEILDAQFLPTEP